MEYELPAGTIIQIDRGSLPIMKLRTWYVGTNGYVYSSSDMLLHRVLTAAQRGEVVDHKNGNTLDNRSHNLRKVTNAENVRCRHHRNSNNTSGFPGVSFTWARGRKPGITYELGKPWFAKITVARKQIALGRFATKAEAATAYETATKHFFGIFAPHTLPSFKRHPEIAVTTLALLKAAA